MFRGGGQTNKHTNSAINKTDWEFYVKSFKFLGREYQTHTSTTTSHQEDMTEMSECHYNIEHIYQTLSLRNILISNKRIQVIS